MIFHKFNNNNNNNNNKFIYTGLKTRNQIKIHKNMQNICSYLRPCLRHKSKLVKWYTIPKENWKNEIEIKTQYPNNASSTR